jgi:hypothetical protein
MEPIGLWILFACTWAVLHWWLVPAVQTHWEASNMRTKMLRSGILVTLEKLRDLAAVGATALALLMVLILLSGWLAHSDAGLPKALVEAIASLFEGTKAFSTGYGTVVGWLGLIGAAWVLYQGAKHARRQVATAWQEQAGKELNAIIEDPDLIEASKAHPDQRPIAEHLQAMLAALHALPDEGQATPEQELERTRLREVVRNTLHALAVEIANQKVDFAEIIGKSATPAHPLPATPWQRLAQMVSSKQFGKDMGLVRKPLGWVVTGLLLFSLTGWAADPLADSFRLTVNNLRVNLANETVQRDLNTALSHESADHADEVAEDTPNAPNSSQVRAAAEGARLVARAVAREMMDPALMSRITGAAQSNETSSEFVRAAVLGEDMATLRDMPDALPAQRVRAEASAAALDSEAAAMRRVEEHLATQIEAPLESLQREHPRRFDALMSRVAARYSAPASTLDAQSKLMARVLDEALGGADFKPSGEMGKQAQALVKDFGKDAIKTWADSAVKRFLVDTISGAARPDVLRGIAFESTERSRAFFESLHLQEEQGWRPSAAAAREARANDAVARTVTDLHADAPQAARVALTERLSGYERLFPGRAAEAAAEDLIADMPTGAGKMAEAGETGGRPHPSAGGGHDFSRTRATNMHTASRSFRVRGVLIGHDLQGDQLDVTDIRWQLIPPGSSQASTRVQLSLRLAAQTGGIPRWQSVGSVDAGVLNQALRYAADRRVVATTITQGDGKVFSRLTSLHPVLLDTPLGCRVIEADRFIDTFSFRPGNASFSPAFSQLMHDREQMMSWLKLMGLAEAVAAQHESACPVDEVKQGVEQRHLKALSFSAPMNVAINRFLNGRDKDQDGGTGMIRLATRCVSASSRDTASCLCAQADAMASRRRYWFPEDHTSQVRERAEPLSPDLKWLMPSSDKMEHLDLWVHTTFALRDGQTGEADESTASALDFPQPSLDALRATVRSKLPSYLRDQLASPNYDAFMAPLEEFVLMQRLMRAAFQGSLGPDFPLARLIELEKQTRSYVAKQPTIRWEPANSMEAMYAALQKSDAHAAETFKAWLRDRADREQHHKPVCGVASL